MKSKKSKGISIRAPSSPLSPLPRQKGISTIIAVVLLLLITIGITWSTYTFLTSATGSITKAGGEKIEKTAEILTSCIKIESAGWNKVYLRNCGVRGKIKNSSIAVFVDGIRVGHNMNPLEVDVNDVGEISLYGLWKFSLGEHKLKVVSGGVMDEVAVRFKPHPSAVLVYTFDEGTVEGNKVKDLSGNNNDGIIYGAQLVDGKFGKALRFDGSNDYVYIPDSSFLHFNSQDSFTVAGWFKLNSLPSEVGREAVIWKNLDFLVRANPINNVNYLYFWVWDGTDWEPRTSAAYALSKSTWYFFTTVYDNSNLKIYLNDHLYGSSTNTKATASTNPVYIAHSFGGEYLNGLVDQVMIFSQALTPDQIYWMEMV